MADKNGNQSLPPKNTANSRSSSSSTSSTGRPMNFIQSQLPNNSGNARPNLARSNGNTISNTNDFMAFFNSGNLNTNPSATGSTDSTMNFLNNSVNSGNNSSSASSASGPNNSTTNPNPMNRLETIRQYYVQLSNNLRLITQQLQNPDIPASRRQALLMEQGRANAAMQEFTEKILKPISASKQLQQQQQQQMRFSQQQQQQQQQSLQQNPQLQQQQMLQYQNSRPPPALGQYNNSNITGLSVSKPPSNQQQQQQLPPPSSPSNVNLYSQSGLGMIRPILNSGPRQGNPAPPSQYRPMMTNSPVISGSPQRPFRPQQVIINSNNSSNTNFSVANSVNSTSPGNTIIGSFPNQSVPSQQPYIVDRQTYLLAAQQHQTSISQQQLLFQQRLALFSRDSNTSSTSPTVSTVGIKRKVQATVPNSMKRFKVSPVLALPPVSAAPSAISNSVSTSMRGNFLLPQSTSSSSGAASGSIPFGAKTSSIPLAYPNALKLTDLAQQFNLDLSTDAEHFLLRIADEFIDKLARKSFSFARHRSNAKKKSNALAAAAAAQANAKGTKKPPTVPVLLTEDSEDFNLTIEDLILGVDEIINYQIAGSASFSNCRPAVRKAPTSTTAANTSDSNTSTAASTTTTAVSLTNHQHRLNLVKKHSSLFQQYY